MHACLKQMTLDLELRGLAKHTKSEYLRYARLFAAYHDRSPEDMGEREIQQFLLHRLVDDKVSHATLKVTVAALRFLMLRRYWVSARPQGPLSVPWQRAGSPDQRRRRSSSPARGRPPSRHPEARHAPCVAA